jgi:DNA (cytosine-5)-methyltransferase 1
MQDLISFWTGSQTNLEQMIANAVPVKLAEYVGSCLMKYCKSQQQQESQF